MGSEIARDLSNIIKEISWPKRYDVVKSYFSDEVTRVKTLIDLYQNETSTAMVALVGILRSYLNMLEISLLFLEEHKEQHRMRAILEDGMDKVTNALKALNDWREKYQPILDEAEKDYKSNLGKVKNLDNKHG